MIGNFLRNQTITTRLLLNLSQLASSKKSITVATLGQLNHGKSTLTAAIAKHTQAQTQANTLKYETQNSKVTHYDYPTQHEYLLNSLKGTINVDTGILVVSAPQGVTQQAIQQIQLSHQTGVKNILVYINRVEQLTTPQALPTLRKNIQMLLRSYQFTPNTSTFVQGSALEYINGTNSELGQESISNIIAAIDKTEPISRQPFVFTVHKVQRNTKSGYQVEGKVEQGQIKRNQRVQVFSQNRSFKTKCLRIQNQNERLITANTGQRVTLWLPTAHQISPGQVVAQLGCLSNNWAFQANLYVLKAQQGGSGRQLNTTDLSRISFKTKKPIQVLSQLVLEQGVSEARPGTTVTVRFRLSTPVNITLKTRVVVHEGDSKVAVGVITGILPKQTDKDNQATVFKDVERNWRRQEKREQKREKEVKPKKPFGLKARTPVSEVVA